MTSKFKFIAVWAMLIALFSAGENEDKIADSKAFIKVVDASGAVLSGIPVQVFDEKTYELFEKDNRTEPLSYVRTDKNGAAVYDVQYGSWFTTSRSRQITFVVQNGVGDTNYEIWAVGRTFNPGKNVEIVIQLKDIE